MGRPLPDGPVRRDGHVGTWAQWYESLSDVGVKEAISTSLTELGHNPMIRVGTSTSRRKADVAAVHQTGRVAPTYSKLPKDEPTVAGKGSARTSAPVCGASTMKFCPFTTPT